MQHKQRDIIVCAGKTGFGKSYLIKNEVVPFYSRIVIFDIKDEYHSFEDFPLENSFVVFYEVEEFREYIKEHFQDETLKIILRFKVVEGLDVQQSYETALAICFAAEDLTIVIEEISNFASPHYYTPLLEQLLRYGRHSRLSLICSTQRIGDVGVLLLTNCDAICIFRLPDNNDISRLKNLSFVPDEQADQVGQLPPHKFILFTNI